MASPRPQKRSITAAGPGLNGRGSFLSRSSTTPNHAVVNGVKRRRRSPSPATPTQQETNGIQSAEAIAGVPHPSSEGVSRGDPVLRMLQILKFLSQQKSPTTTMEQAAARNGLQALVPLLRLPQYQSRTASSLAAALKAYPQSLDVQLEATRVMHALLDSDAPSEVALGAIDCTMTTLLNFPYDSSLHCLGIDLLRKLRVHLIQSDEKIRATCVIFNSHRNHLKVDFLQQVSLCLLAWLVEDKTCRKVLYRLGGLDSILKTMSHYPADPMVQCNATAIICWMIHGSTQHGGADRVQRAAAPDVPNLERWSFPIVLRALTDHFDEVSVFGNCVCLLSGVPDLPDENTVLELVRLGMKIHKTSAKAQEACLRWLRFRNPRQYTQQMISCLPVLLEAMEEHAMDRNVQAQACEVLVMLLDLPETRAAVLEHGTVDAVLKALSNHKSDGHIQHAAIWFLTLLLPFNEESASQREATAAFGGGFLCLETLWKGMGIDSTTQPANEVPRR